MKLSELTPDKGNANKGTQRGLKALDTSLRQYGAGRSILVDKNGVVIAGNKTLERAADIGIDDVIVVESDGTKLVAVKRTDLDLEDDGGKARALATYDNRVGQLDLDWDVDALKMVDSDVLDKLGLNFEDIDYEEAWKGMPEYESEDKTAFRTIYVHFDNQDSVDAFSKLIDQTITNKTKYLWYPYKVKEILGDRTYKNES
jgi:hypothetical protein